MDTARWEKRVYDLKNVITAHTGPVGREMERRIAAQWIRQITDDIDSADVNESKARPSIDIRKDEDKDNAEKTQKMPRIAIAVYALVIGGGEIFPIHLANALHRRGYDVVLIDCGMMEADPKVKGLLEEGLPLLQLNHYRELPKALEDGRIEVVHTHHAVIDLAVSRAIETGKVTARQVITLHGMYEALDKPRQHMLIERIYPSVSCFAYIADKNLEPFDQEALSGNVPFIKLPNGLPRTKEIPVSREALGIPENAFVLCLVSRARLEKGWKEAIDIVNTANGMHPLRTVHLILVGEGEAYDRYHHLESETIHFVGAHQHTRPYLMAADMGFLPSTYAGESFPLTLIDSFMCGKPVIATALGEIPAMLQTGNGPAGYTFSLSSEGKVPIRKAAKAILRLQEDVGVMERMQQNVKLCALRYDISEVAESYAELYRYAASGESSELIRIADKPDRRKEHLRVEKTDRDTVKILISCHKESSVPRNAVMRPIQVGSSLTENHFPQMLRDDKGQNISHLNKSYCEMTAQYWAWKHIKADYYGFFHYRRYLNLSDREYPEDRYGNVYEPVYTDKLIRRYGWSEENLQRLTEQYDIITVKGRESLDGSGRRLTVRQQYAAAPYLREQDLDTLIELVNERYPKYREAMNRYMDGYTAYYCNMYICRADLFRTYCAWVFPLLEEFCACTDMTAYDSQQLRTPGHLAERLWGVYVTYLKMQGQVRIKEAQSIVVAKTENIGRIDTLRSVTRAKKTVHSVVERKR